MIARFALVAALLVPAAALASDPAHAAHGAKPARAPEAVLADLKAGNQRFVAGKMKHPNTSRQRLQETARGQAPQATILGCSDSRVPPELIFDAGVGDLFVVRVAGNVAEEHTLGSIEYAAEHLNVPVVVVLGHHQCGAVKATAEATGPVEMNIGALVREIQPAVDEVKKAPASKDGVVHDAIHLHALKQAEALSTKSPVLKHLIEAGKVKVVTAVYDLDTGKIDWGK